MKVYYHMDAGSHEFRNALCLLAQRWQLSLKEMYPSLQGISFGLRHVERHVIPFSNRPIVKIGMLDDGETLDFTVLMHREVPERILQDLIETELKKQANAN